MRIEIDRKLPIVGDQEWVIWICSFNIPMAPRRARSIVCSARNFFQFLVLGLSWWQIMMDKMKTTMLRQIIRGHFVHMISTLLDCFVILRKGCLILVKIGEDWLETDDIEQFDAAGNLWLVGRGNGQIESGGENVYPEEVEADLSLYPGILSFVVTRMPNARLDEMVVACIQIRENWVWAERVDSLDSMKLYLSNEVLRHYCRHKHLTGFKIPKVFIVWRKPFPLTSAGKLRRDQMKREAMIQLQPLLSNL